MVFSSPLAPNEALGVIGAMGQPTMCGGAAWCTRLRASGPLVQELEEGLLPEG